MALEFAFVFPDIVERMLPAPPVLLSSPKENHVECYCEKFPERQGCGGGIYDTTKQ
jgi:hypothetical protein